MDFPSYEVSDKMGLKVNTLPDGYPAGSIVAILNNKAYKLGDTTGDVKFPLAATNNGFELKACTFGFVVDGSFRLDNIVSRKVSVLQRPGVRVKIHKNLLAEPTDKDNIVVGNILTYGVVTDDKNNKYYGFRRLSPANEGEGPVQLVCKVYNIDTDYIYAETVDFAG
jgi:hypothetical protein